MAIFLIVLVGFIIAGFCYASGSIVASIGNTLTGNGQSSVPSQRDTKRMTTEELLAWANELEQQAKQLQKDQAEWMQESAILDGQYQQIKSKQLPG